MLSSIASNVATQEPSTMPGSIISRSFLSSRSSASSVEKELHSALRQWQNRELSNVCNVLTSHSDTGTHARLVWLLEYSQSTFGTYSKRCDSISCFPSVILTLCPQGNSRLALAWVLNDYVSEVLDLSSPNVFRECVY